MQHLMLDLETLGKRAGCVVLSIALVRLSDNARVMINLDLPSQDAVGLHRDEETVEWWGQQPVEVWKQVTENPYPVAEALGYISGWITIGGGADFRLWGYGAGFDLPVLKELYTRFNIPLPWQHWQEMCARTVRELSGVDPEAYRVLPKHNPLNDAMTQAGWLRDGMQTLYGRVQ
jgi:3' exoribonuclease, RNase T-like